MVGCRGKFCELFLLSVRIKVAGKRTAMQGINYTGLGYARCDLMSFLPAVSNCSLNIGIGSHSTAADPDSLGSNLRVAQERVRRK